MTLGEVIRAARQAIGLTQKEVARRVGVSVCLLSAWECGTRRPFVDSRFANLLRVLKVTFDEIACLVPALAYREVVEGLIVADLKHSFACELNSAWACRDCAPFWREIEINERSAACSDGGFLE